MFCKKKKKTVAKRTVYIFFTKILDSGKYSAMRNERYSTSTLVNIYCKTGVYRTINNYARPVIN